MKMSACARAQITLASPNGGRPPLDPKSQGPSFQTEISRRIEKDAHAEGQLDRTPHVESVKQEDCDTVFYPGGHGPMWDLPEDPNSFKLIRPSSAPVSLWRWYATSPARSAVHLSEGDRTMTGDSAYRFGAFELLVRRQLLVHAGAPVRIGSRALAILTVLVEGAGDLVTKEKLIAAAWPTTFVDDSNLKVNVANLRRALRSNDPGQDYIATVPGHGYRFIAPVHRISMGAGGLPPKIPLIGRADDLAAIQEWLGKNSVVTVAGSGGIGKTVLAAGAAHAVAAYYPDGVTFVDLAKISAALFIPTALAFALGVTTGGEDPLAVVIHALEGQRKLLLIDNCEHLMPAVAGAIDRLSTSLEGVRILATSREPLRIRDEHVHRLDPLKSDPRPSPTAAEASAYPAVELFVTRAFERTGYQLHDADAPNVAEICRRLDGLPLAIELAATRIGALTSARLLEMLDDRFKVLACGSRKAPARQQTLHATLDWSYSLLSDSEAAFARALSVFAGAFSVEGAIALAPDDTPPETTINILSSLAAKSFLVVDWQESAVTYRLLETMRAYLLERLQFAGEENDAKHRHAKLMCAFLERADNPTASGAARERRANREREAAAVLAPVIARVVDGAGTKDFDTAEALLLQLPATITSDLRAA